MTKKNSDQDKKLSSHGVPFEETLRKILLVKPDKEDKPSKKKGDRPD